MTDAIVILTNIALGALWGSVVVKLAPSMWRWNFGTPRFEDGYRAVLFFVACNTLGYLLRSITLGAALSSDWSLSSFVAMRVFSLLCAVFVLRISRGYQLVLDAGGSEL